MKQRCIDVVYPVTVSQFTMILNDIMSLNRVTAGRVDKFLLSEHK